ncbi:hypothetical protein AAF712_015852 [Marasmius tenuissimus]|uniref:Uncharacterized protein n=1 Tax=Marasmius tenuissimus TaxID=585030 RepID=A0ABR2Z883_9AGAR
MSFSKLSTVPQLAVVAAMLFAGAANAERGWAVRNSTLGVTTESCGPCTPTQNPTFKVALPAQPLNPVLCCSVIRLAFNGNNVNGTYTDDCTGGCIDDPTGGPDDGLALSDPLYQALNPGGFGPILVTWNNLGRPQ